MSDLHPSHVIGAIKLLNPPQPRRPWSCHRRIHPERALTVRCWRVINQRPEFSPNQSRCFKCHLKLLGHRKRPESQIEAMTFPAGFFLGARSHQLFTLKRPHHTPSIGVHAHHLQPLGAVERKRRALTSDREEISPLLGRQEILEHRLQTHLRQQTQRLLKFRCRFINGDGEKSLAAKRMPMEPTKDAVQPPKQTGISYHCTLRCQRAPAVPSIFLKKMSM